ncbi:MAG: hypothetical protein MZV70_47655 [Desulfobacterales bacterium]|nr:hypothetical protein [Desulfobacterales bacterium]
MENVMAAVAAARFCGCSQESIIEAVSQFPRFAASHRICRRKAFSQFYDDSKGTNVDAVIRALETFSAPVILLLGGRDKDGNFNALQPLLVVKDKTGHLVWRGA